MEQLRDSLLQLITETATNLPADVRRAARPRQQARSRPTRRPGRRCRSST